MLNNNYVSRDPDLWNLLSMFNRPIRMLSSASFTFAPLWEILSDLAQLSTLVSSDIQIMTWLWLQGVNFADVVKKMLRAEKKECKSSSAVSRGRKGSAARTWETSGYAHRKWQIEDNLKLKFEILFQTVLKKSNVLKNKSNVLKKSYIELMLCCGKWRLVQYGYRTSIHWKCLQTITCHVGYQFCPVSVEFSNITSLTIHQKMTNIGQYRWKCQCIVHP